MSSRIEIPSPSPLTTIYAYRLSVLQRQTITSPRDGTKVHTEDMVPFLITGVIPKGSKYPSLDRPALWKGSQAGGNDTLAWKSEMKGRFPHAKKSRRSTLPG